MSYLICSRCSRKALSAACQCPHCGQLFDVPRSYNVSFPRLHRVPPVYLLVAVGMLYVGVEAVRHGLDAGRPAASPPASAVVKVLSASASPPGPPSPGPGEPVAATSDTGIARGMFATGMTASHAGPNLPPSTVGQHGTPVPADSLGRTPGPADSLGERRSRAGN